MSAKSKEFLSLNLTHQSFSCQSRYAMDGQPSGSKAPPASISTPLSPSFMAKLWARKRQTSYSRASQIPPSGIQSQPSSGVEPPRVPAYYDSVQTASTGLKDFHSPPQADHLSGTPRAGQVQLPFQSQTQSQAPRSESHAQAAGNIWISVTPPGSVRVQAKVEKHSPAQDDGPPSGVIGSLNPPVSSLHMGAPRAEEVPLPAVVPRPATPLEKQPGVGTTATAQEPESPSFYDTTKPTCSLNLVCYRSDTSLSRPSGVFACLL